MHCHSVCLVLFYSYGMAKFGIFTAGFFVSARRSWIEACANTTWHILSEKLPSLLTQKWRCFKVPGRYRSSRLALPLSRDCPKTLWLRMQVVGHPTAYANLPCVWMTDSSSRAPQKPQATALLVLVKGQEEWGDLIPQKVPICRSVTLAGGETPNANVFTPLSLTYLFEKQYPRKHNVISWG